MTAQPVIIDTDPGLGEPGSDIDDGHAIALAVRSPELEVLGLTVVNGNVDAAVGVDVARRLVDRLGMPDLPVLLGAEQPLTRPMQPIRDLFAGLASHRARNSGGPLLESNRDEPAADFLVRTAAERPGEVTVIGIGPMTNLARAFQADPAFAGNVREFVLMAGSATDYARNVNTVGDYNAYVDPEALDIVLTSGARIRMVGIDQTSKVRLTLDDAVFLETQPDDFARYAGACARGWITFLAEALPNRPEHRDGCFLHDPLVVGAVLDPGLLEWADAHVQTDLVSDLARGLVVADRGLSLTPHQPWNASVAVATDVDAFRMLFLTRITNQQGHLDAEPARPTEPPRRQCRA